MGGKALHQLVQGAAPAAHMAEPRRLVAQVRVDQGQFRADIDRPQMHFHAGNRLALFGRAAGDPLPAHDDAFGRFDIEEFTGANVLQAVGGLEMYAEPAADADIGLGRQDRKIVRPPPGGHAFRRRDQVEHDGRPRPDSADKTDAGHSLPRVNSFPYGKLLTQETALSSGRLPLRWRWTFRSWTLCRYPP